MRTGGAAWRYAIGAALLIGLAVTLDSASIGAAISGASPGWLIAALLLSVPQVALSAWRWRYTAARLGAPLGRRQAYAEYYLATFLNQVLPGGVAGDLARAWRHARDGDAGRAAWQAVVIERASGQFVLLLCALAGLAASAPLQAALARAIDGRSGWIFGALLAGTVAVVLLLRRCARPSGRLVEVLRRSLLAREVWPVQLLASAGVVLSYITVFICCARMLGVTLPTSELWPLVPWVLFAMAIPLSVAGWGVREGAAALIWAAAGLDPAQGVAISVAYGLVVLLSSLPGALVLLRQRTRVASSSRSNNVSLPQA
ncbi:lysylphosphatidylglycerol synthase transmembrane domain-containing protein [Methyloversatilis sp.]|uniref:lysylphosphatidylglycerol synthase transmembrane domain-containing protein n=1 Tax=Methyloversatilis sp. TaxID=2569862 RepID=UPI0027349D9A|nr:lysylphosphatidylglycerol synthase transmembrane domain-containing protein [Methyloversatilis sp.]MDP2868633.1 lysylphosphatidylglycerol synthase transmembrane domain-containing protein [Methyloversatilis sp.]MDP3456652.1 lysylphosphatidylglycerol synthase transmembrane domain-containing protein [Methyloversatilis sp.]MDP3577257.1 lysylphosphatidylglycerol synthase transmembrane domain-containing protein [Methyloversatilis sp.]